LVGLWKQEEKRALIYYYQEEAPILQGGKELGGLVVGAVVCGQPAEVNDGKGSGMAAAATAGRSCSPTTYRLGGSCSPAASS